MGILLATAPANRRFLLRRAVARLALCLLSLIGLSVQFSQPAIPSPGRWLALASFWLAVAVGLFFWGLAPFRLLTRTVECYEKTMVIHDVTIPLDQVALFSWRRKRFHLLGLIPTDLTFLELTCRLAPASAKQKRGKTYVFNDLTFLGLFDRFEEAYEHSLPCTYQLSLPPRKRRLETGDAYPSKPTDRLK